MTGRKFEAGLDNLEVKARFGGETNVKMGKLTPDEIRRITAKFVEETNANWKAKNYPYHLAIEPVFYGDTYRKLPTSMDEWAEWQEKAKTLLASAVEQLLGLLDFARKQKWLLEVIDGRDEE